AGRRPPQRDLRGARRQRAAHPGPRQLRRAPPGERPDREGHERHPRRAGAGDAEAAERGEGDRRPPRARGRLEAHSREDLDHLPAKKVVVDEYKELLAKVDAWYRSVKESHPAEVPCTKGCRDCCIGLFDISLADRDLLREGMAAADPALRKDIEERAAAL